jgi:hypothetical protein
MDMPSENPRKRHVQQRCANVQTGSALSYRSTNPHNAFIWFLGTTKYFGVIDGSASHMEASFWMSAAGSTIIVFILLLSA